MPVFELRLCYSLFRLCILAVFQSYLGQLLEKSRTIKYSATVAILILTYGLFKTVFSVHSTVLNLGS